MIKASFIPFTGNWLPIVSTTFVFREIVKREYVVVPVNSKVTPLFTEGEGQNFTASTTQLRVLSNGVQLYVREQSHPCKQPEEEPRMRCAAKAWWAARAAIWSTWLKQSDHLREGQAVKVCHLLHRFLSLRDRCRRMQEDHAARLQLSETWIARHPDRSISSPRNPVDDCKAQ